MQRVQGSYALIQFSPVPERMEFLNVGVVLAVPELNFLEVRFSESHARIDRFFPKQSAGYLEKLKAGLGHRIRIEFARSRSVRALEEFASRRANELRISPFLAVAVDQPASALDRLFVELVGEDVVQSRRPRMAKRLKEAFVKANVYGLLQENPAVVELPEVGISVRAPFGYQNGAFNLIDGMRFGPDRNDAMKEAGKRALEGDLLWKHSNRSGPQKRLVVVADFGDQPRAFYDAVGDQLEESHVRLYRLDNLKPLVEDILEHAALHAT